MVGTISARPMILCCEKVFTVLANKKYETIKRCSLRNLKNYLSQHIFVFVFGLLFLLVLWVLYVTNQKPVYKYSNIKIHDSNDIHDEHNSKNHYGVVIDCGSSGSRVYIYYWPPHSGSKEELLHIKQMLDVDGNPVRLKIRPGISSFAQTPHNASHSLKPLLEFAANHVPHVKHQETPLYIFATAGMRLLSEDHRNGILQNLADQIPKMTKFYFTSSQVEVISGKQEGIYLWIATNYMLDRFDHGHHSHDHSEGESENHKRKPTVGTIEIGGASLQIAYEVQNNDTLSPETTMTINLGCDAHQTTHRYQIYVTTFLGLGTDFGRKTYVNSICPEKLTGKPSDNDIICVDPCLPTDMIDELSENNVPFKLKGTGDFFECQKRVSKTLNVSAECKQQPCSFNGVHHAPIDFRTAEFYGFAEFWYSSNDVLRVGGKYSSDVLEKEAKHFCKTRWSLHKKHYAMGFYPKADHFRFKYQCFKSAWITSVLHDGYKFPKDYQGLTTVQLVKGKELQWTLGALLYHTRFLPLRDMNLENSVSGKSWSHEFWVLHEGFFPILFTLAGIVILLVVVYFRRLHHFSSTITVFPHDSYSSMVTEKNFAYDIRVDM